MNYIMCFTTDLMTDQELNLVKNGNKYYIELCNQKEVVRKHFDNLNDAQAKYTRLVGVIVNCYYDFKTRKEILMED